jgi:hypothetical protein
MRQKQQLMSTSLTLAPTVSDVGSKRVLVTGASSGLGLAASAQLANAGYGSIAVAARTADKAARAGDELVARTRRDVFETIAADVSVTEESVRAAGTSSPSLLGCDAKTRLIIRIRDDSASSAGNPRWQGACRDRLLRGRGARREERCSSVQPFMSLGAAMSRSEHE